MKKKDRTDKTDQTDRTDRVVRDPLASLAGREWLAGVLAAAEYEEANGPEGSGWLHNESLRAGIVERAEFLRELVGLLEE